MVSTCELLTHFMYSLRVQVRLPICIDIGWGSVRDSYSTGGISYGSVFPKCCISTGNVNDIYGCAVHVVCVDMCCSFRSWGMVVYFVEALPRSLPALAQSGLRSFAGEGDGSFTVGVRFCLLLL